MYFKCRFSNRKKKNNTARRESSTALERWISTLSTKVRWDDVCLKLARGTTKSLAPPTAWTVYDSSGHEADRYVLFRLFKENLVKSL